ncbi:MAG: family N-acetyltransferase [Bacilli bacterium]|nr:family N-acetyltransferase [Bacilli bacterium]
MVQSGVYIQIQVFQATIDDLDSVTLLFDEYRIFYDQISDIQKARTFLFEKFEHQESIIFLAKDQSSEHDVGFIQLYPSFSSLTMQRLWILNDLFVSHNHRKQGNGNQLLEAAKSFAIKTNAKGVQLSTAWDNKTAQRLYESLDYKKDDLYRYILQ